MANRFSVLIAAYKAGRYIAKALESIRAQAHTDWEVVVVEDGSRDETEEIVRRFAASVPQPVRYENFGVNRGVAAARSRLLELAAGDAVAFLDADDWWTSAHLEQAKKSLDAGASFVVARIQEYDLAAARPLQSYSPSPALFSDPVLSLFTSSLVRTSSCVAFQRALAARVGAFDASLRINDYWLRCALAGAQFADNGEITCFYAKHAASAMAHTLLWAQQEVAFHEKYLALSTIPLVVRRRALAHHLSNYGRLVRAQDRAASRHALAKSLRLAPSLPAFLRWVRSAVLP